MSLIINNNLMAMNAARNLGDHYGKLSVSVRRLSSGLRVGQASDDAAGLAIRELMRADIRALNQGIRNANDAISLIQTADGALQIIDEKLIRMKELAEQAATGTYNSDQRLMIDSEFQAMAAEIQRIATATDFNGIKLLDGSLKGQHDGSELRSTGELKVHFGTGNDSAEDYYYLNIASATLAGLGLTDGRMDFGGIGSVPSLGGLIKSGETIQARSGIVSYAVIPAGTKNLSLILDDMTQNDSIQIFTRDGKHLAGTTITQNPGYHSTNSDWRTSTNQVWDVNDMNTRVITEENAFLPGATYDDTYLNGVGGAVGYVAGPGNTFNYNGMNFGYSGEGNLLDQHYEYLTIDEATEDLVVIIVGQGSFYLTASWDEMPGVRAADGQLTGLEGLISIQTQQLAQEALEVIDEAIIAKDKIRAYLGAMQNRLENTISNLQIQAENLQAAESRISDTDVAMEMTEFVRQQILTGAAVTMLAQANSMPQMALSVVQG